MITSDPGNAVRIGVGIDTARFGHHVSFLKEDRQEAAAPLLIAESAVGYQKLRRRLEQLRRKYPDVCFHVHVDAAGQYANNLEKFLHGLELPMTISVGEPKRNKDYHQVIFPKRKADATESHAMARFAIVEQPSGTEPISQEIQILREIASRLEAQVKSTTQAINRLHNLLSRVFPELATIASNLAAGWVLHLLAKYPTPERMARAAQSSLAKIPYISSDKAAKIHTAAKDSVGTLQGDLAEELVRQAVTQVRQSQQGERKLEELLLSAFQALPQTGHVQIQTIPGIGPVTAAILVAKIVSIDRFTTAKNLAGYFGVFPEERSSGVDPQGRAIKRTRHMSRKGNDLVRRYLFCAARSAMKHNAAVKALYVRLRARGTRGDVALGHCMRKLLQLVFAVWSKDQPFDNDYYPWNNTDNTALPVSASTEAIATKAAAGPKRDGIPARKEVTTADSKIEHAVVPVNHQPTANATAPPRHATTTESSMSGSIDYPWLRSQIKIEQVLRAIGHFECLKGHQQLRGPCPFHATKRPGSRSFSVNLCKNVYRCLDPDCNAHGNPLDLWAAFHQLPLYEAALNLAKQFQLTLQPDQRRGNP